MRKPLLLKISLCLGVTFMAFTGIDIALAKKPDKWHDNKHNHQRGQEHGEQRRQSLDDSTEGDYELDRRNQRYFNDQHRVIINQYYSDQLRAGHCPPGLQKKRNNCQPPGQAKKWRVGQRLPRDLVYYEVPASIIGPAPAGYRFIRVASDILMIAIGSGMILDAMTDLNGL